MDNENGSKPNSFFKADFSTILKNIFFLLLILQFGPSMIAQIYKGINNMITPKTQVGYLSIAGMISDSVYYTKRIEEFEKNDSIKALFIKIESPGGYPASSEAIYREVKKFKNKKPVVVLVENVCGSGAYYIAAAATKIIAPASALVGSIGNYAKLPNVAEALNSWHIKVNYVQSGEYKTAGSPFKKMTEPELAHLQLLSDSIYSQFCQDVALSRALDMQTVKTWADGKVFTGTQALELKLIDYVGSYHDAVNVLKEIAGIKQEIEFVSIKKRPIGIMQMIMGGEEYNEEVSNMTEIAASFVSSVANKIMSQQQGMRIQM